MEVQPVKVHRGGPKGVGKQGASGREYSRLGFPVRQGSPPLNAWEGLGHYPDPLRSNRTTDRPLCPVDYGSSPGTATGVTRGQVPIFRPGTTLGRGRGDGGWRAPTGRHPSVRRRPFAEPRRGRRSRDVPPFAPRPPQLAPSSPRRRPPSPQGRGRRRARRGRRRRRVSRGRSGTTLGPESASASPRLSFTPRPRPRARPESPSLRGPR